MKQSISLILAFLIVVSIIAGNYFDAKTPQYENNVRALQNDYQSAKKVAEAVRWVNSEVVPEVDDFEKKDLAETNLINLQEELKVTLNTTLNSFDKDKKGYMQMNVTSKIYRNDIKNLLRLFRLKIDNGYVKIKNITIDSSYVNANIELIKFYKD